MSFNEDFTFTRGTGATRINAAGLIVGVDFSSTSITFGTGPKMFTLTADLMVNRDWSIGESVIAVSQAAPLGNMEGIVTAYDPATQVLTIDVATSTGTGTSTNWRIGSLEVRRDADGVLREPSRSNLFTPSKLLSPTLNQITVGDTISDPFGEPAVFYAPNTNNTEHFITNTNGTVFLSGVGYSISFVFKPVGSTRVSIQWGGQVVNNFNADVVSLAANVFATPLANGFYQYKLPSTAISAPSTNNVLRIFPNGNGTFVGDGVSGIYISQIQAEQGLSFTSYIPTTTVAVTRNADTFTFTPAAIAKFRQGQGALVIEANASDAGTAQRAALRLTGPSGEIRFGKQGIATSGNFTKMAEGGDVQLLGNATQTVQNNGLSYDLINPTDTRTGTQVGTFGVNAFAYDGSSGFGGLAGSGANAELLFNANLTTTDGKGFGNTTLNGVHHNGSRFIIATSLLGIVGISTDGLSYRRVNTPVITQACNEVTSGMVGPTLRNVIVGAAGFIATSDDNGETWVSRTSGTGSTITGATHSTTNFVVAISSPSSSTNLRTSTDGITWNAVANSGVGNSLLDVHANGATVVAVGGGGAITVSNDNGATWAAATSSGVVTTQTLNGVHYNAIANLWVAVGNAGTIITAVDPTGTWTLQTSGTGANLLEVNYFNGLWLASLSGGNTILTSPNAVTWTLRGINSNGTVAINGIAASPTRLIITGSSGSLISSEDGLTYTSRTNNNATLNGIAFGAGVYVSVSNAVNGSGYIATIDGAGTVTRRVSGTTGNINNVRFLNGKFYTCYGSSGGFGISSDGSSWVQTTLQSGLAVAPTDIAYTGTILVGVGGNRTAIFDDTNDTSFIGAAIPVIGSGISLQGIDFANGVLVSVGTSGTIVTGVVSGTTVTWTARTSGTTQNLTSVMYSQRDQRWYAAGNAGTLLYSEDNGVTWASVNNAGFGAVSNTTLQVNKLLPQWKTGRNTMALSYKENEVIVGLNGVAVTDTANTIPSITAGVLGESFNGKIKSAKFQPNPLTAAEVVAITGVTK